MMKAIVKFYEGCIRVIADTQKRSEMKMSMAQIEMFLSREENGDVMEKLIQMKFTDPTMDKALMKKQFDDLHNDLDRCFQEIGT